MNLKTVKDLVNYIGIFGKKVATQMKNADEVYQKFSYNDYQTNSKLIAAYFQRVKRMKKGDMVSIYSENCPEWLMAYFGIVYNGLWAVPLDARLTDIEVKNLITDCKAKIMFTTPTLYENISEEPEIMRQIEEFIIFDLVNLGKNVDYDSKKVKLLSQILDESRNLDLKEVEVDENDVASLIYTSGTTGNPKGVMLTHKNLAHQFNNLTKAVPIMQEDIELSILPLHHTFEFSIELTIFQSGATITYAESLKPKNMLANIEETKVTILIGVPLIYEKIYDGIMRQIRSLPIPIKQIIIGLYYLAMFLNKFTNNKAGKVIFGFLRKKANLNNIKFMISGAAPLNYKVAKGYETLGFILLNGYGLTESSPVISVNRLDRKIKNESVGLPVPGVQVRIDEPDSEGNGEILAKGDNIMLGYYKNPKATSEVLSEDGWLRTGDIGKIDNEGYIYITGRKKNIIVTPGGKNVYPEEIEEEINNSPFVLESLIVGVPESQYSKGENIYCYVVPNYEYFDTYGNLTGIKITEQFIDETINKIIREVNNKLPEYKRIRGYRIRREEFEKTSTKKIKRFLFSGKDFLNT